MNQSKEKVVVLATLLSMLAFIALFLYKAPALDVINDAGISYAYFPSKISSYDALWYAAEIDAKEFNSWHSVLFQYNIHFIQEAWDAVFQEYPRAIQVQYWLSWGAFLLFLVANGVLIRKLSQVRPDYAWAGLLVAALCSCNIFLWSMPLTMEAYFIGPLFVCLAILSISKERLDSSKKILWFALLLVMLFVCAQYRKNAVLLLPVVVGIYVKQAWPVIRCSRLVLSIAVFTSLIIALGVACHFMMPHKTKYPLVPMMVSDIKCAAILTDNLPEAYKQLDSLGLSVTDKHYSESLVGSSSVKGSNKLSSQNWENLKKLYLASWCNNPIAMIWGRVIQTVHFMSNGYTPPLLKNLTEICYPSINNYPALWGNCQEKKMVLLFYGNMILYTLGVCASIWSAWTLRCKKIADEYCHQLVSHIFIVGILTVVYLFSFFVAIPAPAPSYRYHDPLYPMAIWCIVMWVIYWNEIRLKEKSSEK